MMSRSKKTGERAIGDSAFMKTLEEVAAMLREERWSEAKGEHFVALYADLYFRVYDMLPGDLGPKERVFATKEADRILESDFGGDRDAFAHFVSWSWTREKGRERWRRENGREGGRIDSIALGRRALTEKTRIALAEAAGVPPHWVEALIDATRRPS